MKNNSTIKHDITKAPKTGDWRYEAPVVDKEKCQGCGTCVKFCPEGCMELTTDNRQLATDNQRLATDNKKVEIDYAWCKGCGVCAQVCPVKAIAMRKN